MTRTSTEFNGYSPAFYWQDGYPALLPSEIPPSVSSTKQNGRGIYYRPLESGRLPYAQQWNLTIERQLTNDMFLSVAYVANKGTRLPSSNVPINVLNPQLLSMGAKLNDTFESGMTELDGVPIPYAGWIEQMQDCSPTVAQALLPYPQYCGTTQGLNEQAGSSSYHSFQTKLEKRFSGGLYILGSYTMSKLLSSGSAETQRSATTWNGSEGNIFSPYERWRNKSLAPDDVPQVFSLALVYDMPFGKGKRWMNQGGAINTSGELAGQHSVPEVFRSSVFLSGPATATSPESLP